MDTEPNQKSGWKPIPLPLKILSAVLVFWALGAVMNLPNLMENGLPLFGKFVFGTTAASIAIFLDLIGPFVFLLALWFRKTWAAHWAFFYLGIFILNNLVALFAVRQELGLPQILVPTIAAILFVLVIFWQRSYFHQKG